MELLPVFVEFTEADHFSLGGQRRLEVSHNLASIGALRAQIPILCLREEADGVVDAAREEPRLRRVEGEVDHAVVPRVEG